MVRSRQDQFFFSLRNSETTRLQDAWREEFGASKGAAAWTVSLLSGGYLLSGPIASALANIYGCRLVTAVGCVVSGQ